MEPRSNGSSSHDAQRAAGADSQEPPQASSASQKPAIKKRTKTGCLTCRRRRIKCDEGKPRCNNCIKSKRQCDGYNQRVIFKDPMGTFQSNHMGPIAFQSASAQAMLVNPHLAAGMRNVSPTSQGNLPFIAPRPPITNEFSHQHIQQHGFPLHGQPFAGHPGQPPQSVHLDAAPYLLPTQGSTHLDPSSFTEPWPQPPPAAANPDGLFQVDGLPSVALDAGSGMPPSSAHVAAHGAVEPPVQWTSADEERTPAAQRYRPHAVQEHGGTEPRPRYDIFREEDAYWYSDDDASMVDSGEEEESDDEVQQAKANDLGAFVVKRLQNRPFDTFGTQMRSFSNFVDASVLANYVPSSINSPLNDPQTAAVFWYFVNVTGPCMSLFERHPIDATAAFQGQPIPRSRQHTWNYIFPIMAFSHPALLQAMLALGSLQMATLQGTPHTASMKHYHLSLRRVARNYQSASRRVQPATLAATMLLGWYEIWNSDHDKWCKHMWGARAILKEIPLKDMTRKIIGMKREKRRQLEELDVELDESDYGETIVKERDIDQVDPALLAQLAAEPVAYEDGSSDWHDSYSYFPKPASSWTVPPYYTAKDIETYELIADVYWWYCKMDVYQSILGGTPLLMDYSYWTQCAPRAPIGKIDAIHGTYDHLMLLLGRLCNFAAKDASRKRLAMKRQGPPPGGAPSPPPFVGMIPSTGRVTIPAGFSPPREASPPSESSEEMDFESRTAAALSEWEEIRKTFEVFRAQLGPDFDPLGPEYEPPVASPFGTALKYRTYRIAGVWLNLYMGLIVLHRYHPSMPPVAMAAAGMAARQTAVYANEMGRMVAGLTNEDLSTLTHLSTVMGAVSIECSFPMFVAAIQLQDTAQRHWTVKRMQNIGRLTGFQTATQIATGCEIAWTKSAETGRGAPYEPPTGPDYVPLAKPVRKIVDRVRELEEENQPRVLTSSDRAHYALGLLSVEEDLENLELSDRN